MTDHNGNGLVKSVDATPYESTEIVKSRLSEDPKLAKKIMVYLSHLYTGEKLKVIGEQFNLGMSGVSQLSRRFNCQLKRDHDLKKLIAVFVKELNLSNVKI